MAQKFFSHLLLAQKYWKDFLQPNDHVIDATAGNGQDTLFLAQQLPFGKVYAFDVQKMALENTHLLIDKHHLTERVSLFLSSHEHLLDFAPQPIRLIVYNLGYLPGGDKKITTLSLSTQKSLCQALKIIEKTKGALSIMCYPGHEEGKKEQELLLSLFSSLDPKLWEVCYHQWTNRLSSPTLFWIKRLV
jgi:tRNA1(Val) A37 N6-methylase TrmN6